MVIEQVDTDVTVTVIWTGPEDMALPADDHIRTIMQPSSRGSTLIFTPLTTADAGDYTCGATVSSSEFVSESRVGMDKVTVTVKGN